MNLYSIFSRPQSVGTCNCGSFASLIDILGLKSVFDYVSMFQNVVFYMFHKVAVAWSVITKPIKIVFKLTDRRLSGEKFHLSKLVGNFMYVYLLQWKRLTSIILSCSSRPECSTTPGSWSWTARAPCSPAPSWCGRSEGLRGTPVKCLVRGHASPCTDSLRTWRWLVSGVIKLKLITDTGIILTETR